MRIAFISDIHANLTALEAVLADLQAQTVDQIVCLGDAATLGPQPLETLARLRELECIYIRGNHDEALLDPARMDHFQIAKHLAPDLHWCLERLSREDLAFIGSFEPSREILLPDGSRVLCYHGSPLASTDMILASTAGKTLDRLFDGHPAEIYIGGHTHIQMARRHGSKLILNSGSVGNAFAHAYKPGSPPTLLPWAEYAFLEQSGGSLRVDLRRVRFDTRAVHEAVDRSDLPGAAWWREQYRAQPNR